MKKIWLYVVVIGMLMTQSVLVLAQDDDQLRLKICDTEGRCCVGHGLGQPVDDVWIDPMSGNLQVTGMVQCLPGRPTIVDFSVTPETVPVDQEYVVAWSVENADECFATSQLESWIGPRATSGSETYTATGPADTYALVLYCANEDGDEFGVVELIVTD